MSISSAQAGTRTNPDSCGGSCTLDKILAEGICKTEFLAFDTCYDAAEAKGDSVDACLHLFDKFRECLQLQSKVNGILKGAMG